jgi:hypothetical protein
MYQNRANDLASQANTLLSQKLNLSITQQNQVTQMVNDDRSIYDVNDFLTSQGLKPLDPDEYQLLRTKRDHEIFMDNQAEQASQTNLTYLQKDKAGTDLATYYTNHTNTDWTKDSAAAQLLYAKWQADGYPGATGDKSQKDAGFTEYANIQQKALNDPTKTNAISAMIYTFATAVDPTTGKPLYTDAEMGDIRTLLKATSSGTLNFDITDQYSVKNADGSVLQTFANQADANAWLTSNKTTYPNATVSQDFEADGKTPVKRISAKDATTTTNTTGTDPNPDNPVSKVGTVQQTFTSASDFKSPQYGYTVPSGSYQTITDDSGNTWYKNTSTNKYYLAKSPMRTIGEANSPIDLSQGIDESVLAASPTEITPL